MFAGTGFSSRQGSPLLINYWCHLLGAGLKPVNSLVGLPAENGKGVSIGQAWKIFIKCTCKFLHFTLF